MSLAQENHHRLLRAHQSTRVLVAEDDPEMRALVEQTLERDGFEVVAVGDAAAARLELLIAANSGLDRMPAVLVTDRYMPDGDGIELAAEVRRRWWWMPVVLVTGFADAEARRSARALGCCRVLSKPFDPDILRLAVRESVQS